MGPTERITIVAIPNRRLISSRTGRNSPLAPSHQPTGIAIIVLKEGVLFLLNGAVWIKSYKQRAEEHYHTRTWKELTKGCL